jgi:hypothetical protein
MRDDRGSAGREGREPIVARLDAPIGGRGCRRIVNPRPPSKLRIEISPGRRAARDTAERSNLPLSRCSSTYSSVRPRLPAYVPLRACVRHVPDRLTRSGHARSLESESPMLHPNHAQHRRKT